jgi:hypothetical protein
MTIYPNPFHESMRIEYELLTENATLAIYNTIGQVVENHFINNKNGVLEVGQNLEKGVYFIRIIQNEKTSETKKIVKF